MVIVFPMLVSQSVSENVIPGIAKSVEGYLIINHMSDIMETPEVRTLGNVKGFRTTKKGWFAREGVELSEASRDDYIPPGSGSKGKTQTKGGGMVSKLDVKSRDLERMKQQRDELEKRRDYLEKKKRDQERETREKEEWERRKEEEDARKRETRATANVRVSDYKTLSLEPSYVLVEITTPSGALRKEFVGVKVVPYRVNSSEKLSRLIMHDTQVNALNAMMVTFGRKVIRGFYRLLDKWTGRIKSGSLTVSGDPRRDIIMARSGQKGLGIIVLSRTEDVDEKFLQNYSRVNRLFKMGWGNIVVADDITRTAYFCMKDYKGVCSAVNYAMMYQTLGQLKVYDSLEDAQRQNSSLFKISKRISKVFSEWVTDYKRSKYISEDK
jgi:hypothetical protein